MTEPLIYNREGAVAIISINDAPWNRMSLAFIDQLEVLANDIAIDESIRAVVLTGEGNQNFSVGMDLKQLSNAIAANGDIDALLDQRLQLADTIQKMGKPWIATLFGYCLGGGLEIPLACHFRLAATEGAQIGLPEMDLGSVPAWSGSARLTKLVGEANALDMILRGKKIGGAEALRIGLVHEAWPLAEMKERAIALAHELAAQPALAMQAMLKVIVGGQDRDLQTLIKAEREAVHATFGSSDYQEGMAAFLEKRTPVFNKDTDDD